MQRQSYRISTITATAAISSRVDLDDLYDRLACQGDIVTVKHGDRVKTTLVAKESKRKTRKVKKSFDNQLSLVFFSPEKGTTNVKIFCNGQMQVCCMYVCMYVMVLYREACGRRLNIIGR